MKTIGQFEFPTTMDEARVWRPDVTYVAIHPKVLLVAKTRAEGAWKAYCVPVPGKDHEYEKRRVDIDSSSISESLARVAFPRYSELPYAN